MIEALLVLGLVALISTFGVVAPVVPPEWCVQAGWLFTGAGLLVGVPAGLGYHWKLRAGLLRVGGLPARWWVHPSPLNRRLDPEDRSVVMFLFYLGGAGAALAFLGCLLVGAGVVLAALRAGAL